MTNVRSLALRQCCMIAGMLLAGGIMTGEAQPVTVIEDRPFWQETHAPYPLGSPEENDARAVAVDGQGRVWAATAAGARFLKAGAWRAPAGGEKAGPTFAVHADRAGRVWIGAWNGLFRVEQERLERADFPAVPVSALAEESSGSEAALYAAGPDGIWRNAGRAWEKLDGLWANTIRDIRPLPDGSLWIASAGGLYRFDRNGSERRARLYSRPGEVASSNAAALTTDARGRLWAGGSGGMDMFENGKRVRSLTVKDGLPNRSVRALACDADGRLWAGTRLGVARWDGAQWSLRHSRRWLLHDEVRDIAIGPDGTAWIATAGGVSAIRRQRMTLADKEAHYRRVVRERHIRPPGLIGPALLEPSGDLSRAWVSDTDNDGQHTGVLCATEAFRYAVTGAQDARENARQAFRALEMLQAVTGTPHFVARTMIPADAPPQNDLNRAYTPEQRAEERAKDLRYKPVEQRWLPSEDGKWLWKRDTSSDEIAGHLFAYAAYYDLVADEAEKRRVAALVERVVGGIVDNGFYLIDIDGRHTRWGVWAPEKLNADFDWREERGNNSLEMLAHLRAAFHITRNPKYAEAAHRLITQHGYARNALLEDYGTPSERTHITDFLLGLAYPNLMAYEPDAKLRRLYQRGMRNWHRVIKKDGIPFYDFVYNRFSGSRTDLSGSAATLRDWPLDVIEWTVDNREREDARFETTPGSDEERLTRMLPRSEMGITPWDQEPYKAVIGNGARYEDKNDCWPVCYWMGRYYGFITPPKDAPTPSR